jgi:peptide/nickel transport system substrate-binding protein
MLQAGDADVAGVGSTADWPQMDQITGLICQGTDQDCEATENPDAPLELIRGWPQSARTDIFMNYALDTTGGNNFMGSGELDGNGIPADFFSNIHIRKGFAYCFNYDAYLEDVLLNEGTRSPTVMLPGMPGYDENAPIYAYDPALCEEEMKLAEFDGVSVWDTGFRLTVGYNTGNTGRQTVAQILQAELSAVNENFVVEVTGLPWPTYLRNLRAKKLPIFVTGWLEDIHDPHNWTVPYTTATYGIRQNLPEDLIAIYDDINTRGVSEPDPAKRAEIYAEFNQVWYDNIHTILLFMVNGRRYQQRWVEGWYNNMVYPGTYYYVISKQ